MALETFFRASGARRVLARGGVFFRQGERSDHVAFIASGQVKVSCVSPGGYVTVLALRGPGELLGEFAAIDHQARSATVEVIERAELFVVAADRLRTALATQPNLAFDLLNQVVHRVREADRRRMEYGSLPATRRVARILSDLAAAHGQPQRKDGAEEIAVALDHQALAGAAGTSRESVVRAIRELKHAGIVRTGRGTVYVTRPDLLLAFGAATVGDDSSS